jgi:hypothetical protein
MKTRDRIADPVPRKVIQAGSRRGRIAIILSNQRVCWISLSKMHVMVERFPLGTLPFLANSSVVLPQMCFVLRCWTRGGHAEGADVLGSGVV